MSINIFLVEDNIKLAHYIKEFLQGKNYCVDCESRGDKAVYRILRKQPDIVILDVMLPGLNGIQVCQSIREEYPGMILMLTALEEDANQITGLSSGADDYVVKPIQPDVLLARLQALQRRNQCRLPKKIIQFGCLKIDMAQKQVWLAETNILLTPSEFELLVFLAKNANYTVSRETITQALRGISYDGIDRSIDLRISYLRKKMGDNVKKPYRIKTVHAKGYLLVANAWEK